MDKNRKLVFWTSIGFSVAGVANLILFAVLSSMQIVATRNLSYVFAVGFIASVWVPMMLNLLFKIKFDLILLISYNAFMFLSICCGSLWGFYTLLVGFDKFIHFVSGVLFAILAYNLFNNGKKNKVSLVWLFIICFSISMMCGGLWEIYEFTTDILLGNNAQGTVGQIGRDAIMDTMFDLVCDFVGSLIGAAVAVLLERHANKTNKHKILKGDKEKETVNNTKAIQGK